MPRAKKASEDEAESKPGKFLGENLINEYCEFLFRHFVTDKDNYRRSPKVQFSILHFFFYWIHFRNFLNYLWYVDYLFMMLLG